MIVANELGSRMADAARRMIAQGRWSPGCEAVRPLFDLERLLSIRIQAGQPALEAMNASLVSSAMAQLIAVAAAAISAGGIVDATPEDVDLFVPVEADRPREEPLLLAVGYAFSRPCG